MRQINNPLKAKSRRLGAVGVWMAKLLALLSLMMVSVAIRAATLTEAVQNRFNDEQQNNGCSNFIDPLKTFCTNQVAAQSSSGTGSQTQSATRDIFLQQRRKIRIAGGQPVSPSPDSLDQDWGSGFSTFLIAGAKTLRHRGNPYEQGYDSTMPSVSFGGDYRVTDNLIAGMAFNYFNWNANFDTAGGFNINSYGPLFYVSYMPVEDAFIDLSVGYSHQDNSRSRLAQLDKKDGSNPLVGSPTANFDSNYLQAGVQTGYDFRFDELAIGPRVGVNLERWLVDNYEESGTSGLELRYSDLDQLSVQSSVGAQASLVIPVSFGTITPSLTGSWVHEFANNQRNLTASFVYDKSGTQFSFQTETPARDWAVIDVGVSVLTSQNLSGFVSFSTIQGNRRFEGYGGNAGVRLTW